MVIMIGNPDVIAVDDREGVQDYILHNINYKTKQVIFFPLYVSL